MSLDKELIQKTIEARKKTLYPPWKVKEIMKNMNRKLPDISTNPNKIYRNWIAEGLQPDKFQNQDDLFKALKKILNTEKGANGKQIKMAEALLKLFPEGYNGIPLDMQYKGSISKGTREVTNVVFDKRKFREMIPLEVKKYFQMQEDLGVFPKGTLNKYQKYISAGNERNRKLAVRLSKLTGIPFDKGHIYGLFNKIGDGGSHDPAAQIAELLSENRGKVLDNIPKELAASLDVPPNWQQSSLEFVNRLTGGLSGSQLPVDKVTGKTLSDADLGKVTRLDFSPDQVVANKWKQIHDAISEAELAKANNTIPQYLNNISSRIDKSGNYIQKFGTGNPNVKGEILSVGNKLNMTSKYLNNAVSPVIKTARTINNIIPTPVKVGAGLTLSALDPLEAATGIYDYATTSGDDMRSKYARGAATFKTISGLSGTTSSIAASKGNPLIATAAALTSAVSGLIGWRSQHLADNYKSPLQKVIESLRPEPGSVSVNTEDGIAVLDKYDPYEGISSL